MQSGLTDTKENRMSVFDIVAGYAQAILRLSRFWKGEKNKKGEDNPHLFLFCAFLFVLKGWDAD